MSCNLCRQSRDFFCGRDESVETLPFDCRLLRRKINATRMRDRSSSRTPEPIGASIIFVEKPARRSTRVEIILFKFDMLRPRNSLLDLFTRRLSCSSAPVRTARRVDLRRKTCTPIDLRGKRCAYKPAPRSCTSRLCARRPSCSSAPARTDRCVRAEKPAHVNLRRKNLLHLQVSTTSDLRVLFEASSGLTVPQFSATYRKIRFCSPAVLLPPHSLRVHDAS